MFEHIQKIATALLLTTTASTQLVSCDDFSSSNDDMRSAFRDTESYVKTFDQQGNTMSKIEGKSVRVSVDHDFDIKNKEGEISDQSEVLEIKSGDTLPLTANSLPNTLEGEPVDKPEEETEEDLNEETVVPETSSEENPVTEAASEETEEEKYEDENEEENTDTKPTATEQKVEHKTIYHYGSPLIIEEVGIENVFDKESYDVVGQPYINYLKETYKDKNSIVLVQAQDYTPIAAYVGNNVKLNGVSNIPNSAIITIDNKKLFLYKTNYSIYDSDLVDPLEDAIEKLNEEEKEKLEKNQNDLFKFSDLLNPETENNS